MRIWLLLLAGVGFPLLAVAALPPKPPHGFASQRFAPVVAIGQFPLPVWHAVQEYVKSRPVGDAGVERHSPGVCVQPNRSRVFALGGVGANLDFVVYRHFPDPRDVPDHDHLLVFKHGAGGARSLAFSCVGDYFRRKIAVVRAAVADGRCREETGQVETY